jgi:hypothetical protein
MKEKLKTSNYAARVVTHIKIKVRILVFRVSDLFRTVAYFEVRHTYCTVLILNNYSKPRKWK